MLDKRYCKEALSAIMMTRGRWNLLGGLLVAAALVGVVPAPAAAQSLLCPTCARPRQTPEIDPGTLRGAVVVLAGVALMVADRRRRS